MIIWRIKSDEDVIAETPYVLKKGEVLAFPDGRGPYKVVKVNPWDYVYHVEKVSE